VIEADLGLVANAGGRNQGSIQADLEVTIIRITRSFDSTPAELMRAHTDPEPSVRWTGGEDRLDQGYATVDTLLTELR
jgi:hypothetical protein